MSGPRHFLDLDALDGGTLRAILDLAGELKGNGAARRAALRRQGRGDDLRPALDPDAGLVRARDQGARRRRGGLERQGHAARPRRDHRRYRARALALRRRDHDPHRPSRQARRAGRGRDRAGDQRPHRPLAPLPDHGRRDDLRGPSRADPRPHAGLDRRRQQRRHLLDPCGAALRLQAPPRLPAGARAQPRGAGLGGGAPGAGAAVRGAARRR